MYHLYLTLGTEYKELHGNYSACYAMYQQCAAEKMQIRLALLVTAITAVIGVLLLIASYEHQLRKLDRRA